MGLLVRRAFDPYQLPLLIEAVFSSKDEHDNICHFSEDDAQTFIDVIDEARSAFAHHCDTWLNNLTPTLSVNRHWMGPAFRHRPERNVSNRCTGRVAVTHFFRKLWRSPFAMTEPASRCTGVGMGTCGKGNTAVGRLQ